MSSGLKADARSCPSGGKTQNGRTETHRSHGGSAGLPEDDTECTARWDEEH